MKRLLLLQAIGCIVFTGFTLLFYITDIFSPVSMIVLYSIMGVISIINANKYLMQPMKEISTHDELTGCYNRVKLDSKIGEYENIKTYSIIFFDVNNLKAANDFHGHDYGDVILVKASNQLRYWHTYGHLYRIGGDEFIVVIPNMSLQKVEKLIYKWYDELSILNTEYKDDFICDFSYGIGHKGKFTSKPFDHVLKEADDKMYEMKKKKGAIRRV